MRSGAKYVGAAVLARTICQRGTRRLESGNAGSLKRNAGWLHSGHAEPVEVLRATAR